ncbi:MAG: HXXEE domain-containing protein [Spirochaetes bacterium]|nr:HXXEE domain-containing protein [Spirochaetota bacterium]
MNRRIADAVIPGVITAALVVVYAIKSPGFFSIYFALSYILYLLTFYKRMPDLNRVVPLYLLAVGMQLLHFAEEFVTGYQTRIAAEIYHVQPFTINQMVISQMVLFFFTIVGAIAIVKKWKIPMFMVWFVVIMQMMVNAVQHPIFSIMVHGYFPGLITSQVGWVLGPILFKRLWEVRRYPASGNP